MSLAEVFTIALIGCILMFSSIVRSIFIYQNKPKFTEGNIFWNYFRLIFSSKSLVCNRSIMSRFSPEKVYCSKCKKSYNSIHSETNIEMGRLCFLGIWKWGEYEKIQCFCEKILGFTIKPNLNRV